VVVESRFISCVMLTAVLATYASCRRHHPVIEHSSVETRPDLSQCPDDFVAGVGGADQAPVLVHRVDPDFRGRPGVRGVVILETVIARSGDVCGVRVLRGLDPALDAAAIAAVRQWKFTPAKKRGEPVQAVFNLTVSVPAP